VPKQLPLPLAHWDDNQLNQKIKQLRVQRQ
jgi:hypothetical protein